MKYTEYAKYCNEGKLLATFSEDIQEVINRVFDDVDENLISSQILSYTRIILSTTI